MESKEFVEKELRNFIEKFPQSRVRYEFREFANAYFIEVLPREVYSSNAEYMSWESEMWDKFVEHYPEEGICFISDGMLVEIKNPELTLYGDQYLNSLIPIILPPLNFNKSKYQLS